MYSHAQVSPFGRPMAQAQAYRVTGVETGVAVASPHRLISMLFDGFVDAVAQGRGAIRSSNVELKCKALSRAVRIVDEGLKSSLDVKGGGELATDLQALYEYITMRLTQANLRSDEKPLDECLSLIQPLREAWNSIAAQVDGRPY
jgi:flagellar secretion chaperone FliS